MASERIQIQNLRSADVLSGDSVDINVASHFDGVGSPKLPTSEELEFGEIALNIAQGYETIVIKNDNNEIVYIPFNVTEKTLELSSATSSIQSNLEELSSSTKDSIGKLQTEIEAVSGESFSAVTKEYEEKLINFELVQAKAIAQLNASMGFTVNGIYTPKTKEFSGMTVTEAIDTIASGSVSGSTCIIEIQENIAELSSATLSSLTEVNTKIDDNFNVLSGELGTRQENIEGYIIDDEEVYSNFAAIINNTLGFDEHAQYIPETPILSGKTVTEAIDSLYNNVENDIQEEAEYINDRIDYKVSVLSSETMSYTDGKFETLSGEIASINEYLQTDESMHIEKTVRYEKLVNMVEKKELIWGVIYRITNYQATVGSESNATTRLGVVESQPDTSNGFDIIVRATSDCTLDENAVAMISPNKYYFEDCAVSSWKIKYSLANDKSRFSWADDNGFGVIYYMQDEYGNEAPYDFKNIKFKKTINYQDKYWFTFSNNDDLSDRDMSIYGKVYGNSIKQTFNEYGVQQLNHIILASNNAHGNEFASGCKDIVMTGTQEDNKISTAKNSTLIEESSNTLHGYKLA